jgi:hypothetical protein
MAAFPILRAIVLIAALAFAALLLWTWMGPASI